MDHLIDGPYLSYICTKSVLADFSECNHDLYREVCLEHIFNKSMLTDFSGSHPDLMGCGPDLQEISLHIIYCSCDFNVVDQSVGWSPRPSDMAYSVTIHNNFCCCRLCILNCFILSFTRADFELYLTGQ